MRCNRDKTESCAGMSIRWLASPIGNRIQGLSERAAACGDVLLSGVAGGMGAHAKWTCAQSTTISAKLPSTSALARATCALAGETLHRRRGGVQTADF